MKAAVFLVTLSALVAGSNAKRLRTNQQELEHVHEMIDIGLNSLANAEVTGIKMPTLGQNEDHGFSFLFGVEFGDTKVKKVSAEDDTEKGEALKTYSCKEGTCSGGEDSAASNKVLTLDFGMCLEPEKFGPFVSFKFNFPKSFSAMFPKITAAVKKMLKKIQVPQPVIDKVNCLKDLYKEFKSFNAAQKEKMKKYKVINWIMEHGFIGVNSGNRGNQGSANSNSNHGNDGWLYDFQFADPGNDGNPSLQIEWRMKDSNELTSCCIDILNPLTSFVPAIAPGTCGWSNQGLHAQGQIGGVNYVKAIASLFLPIGKSIDDYIVKDGAGKPKTKTVGHKPFDMEYKVYDFAAMKKAGLDHFKEMGAEGGVVSAFVATLINGVVNAAVTALKDAKFTTTVELRALIFTAGFTGSFQIKDAIALLKKAVKKVTG